MSRTYRRKDVKRLNGWTYLPEIRRYRSDYGYVASEQFSRRLDRFHDDRPTWGAPWSQNLKEETRTRRRADERAMLHDILSAPDPEDVDHMNLEKLYLGFIWNWD